MGWRGSPFSYIFPGPRAHILLRNEWRNVEGRTLDIQAQTREPGSATSCYLWDLLGIPLVSLWAETTHGHWFLPCFTSKTQFPYLRNG